MQNGPKTVMSRRQHEPAAPFAARSKRWASSAARPEKALARAEAQSGNVIGAENYYQHRGPPAYAPARPG